MEDLVLGRGRALEDDGLTRVTLAKRRVQSETGNLSKGG